MADLRRTSGPRRRVAAAITAILAQEDPAQIPAAVRADPSSVAGPELLTAGRYHRVLPALHVALGGAEFVSPEVRRELRVEHHAQVFRHAAALADLAWFGEILTRVGCPWAVVKGPHLSEAVHARPDLRSYGDLDVLIDHRALPAVARELEAGGAVFLDRNWILIRDGERAQTSLLLPGGTPLDLHWHLLNRGPVRHAFRLDMDQMLGRATPRQLGHATAPVLDDEDVVIHLSLHGTLSGASRLVWLYDLHAAMTRLRPTGEVLATRARENGSALAVAVLLARTRHEIGTPVSDELLDALAPRGLWRRAAAVVDAVRPVGAGYDARRTGRTFIRATRSDDRTSWREFRTTAARNTWGRLRHDTSRPGIGQDDDDKPNPLWVAGGTDADRDALFASVARSRHV